MADIKSASERHDLLSEEIFTPYEIADRLKLSVYAVRTLFRDEPSVILVGRTVGTYKRRSYTTMRTMRRCGFHNWLWIG